MSVWVSSPGFFSPPPPPPALVPWSASLDGFCWQVRGVWVLLDTSLRETDYRAMESEAGKRPFTDRGNRHSGEETNLC